MILLKIFDIKDTMAGLLLHEDYDSFYLEDVKVTTFAKMQLSGFRNRNWYDGEEAEELPGHVFWKEVRPFVFFYIKGKKTPSSFQISLRAPDWQVSEVLGGTSGKIPVDLFLHFRFEEGELSVVTGCYYHEFTMDKEAEFAWDQAVKQLFRQKKISYEAG